MSAFGAVVVGVALAQAARLNGWELDARQAVHDHQARLRRPVLAQAPTVGAGAASRPERAFLDGYCVTCHNERRLTAGLALDKVDPANVRVDQEMWEKVVRKLGSGAMPPAGARRPAAADSQAFLANLVTALDRAAAANPNPGRPPAHRLNRAEYANAIRDLLALEVDARQLLPADDSGYGFDNNADVLTVSPALLERYMSAARTISRGAVGDLSIRPLTETYKMSVMFRQDDRMSDELPFGSRGGLAVRHHFPLDGEYALKITLQRTWQGSIRGLAESHQLDVFLDRVPVMQFTVGGECEGSSEGSSEEPRCNPKPREPGRTADVSDYEQTADRDLEVRFFAKAGPRLVSVTFRKDAGAPEGALEPPLPVTSFEYAGEKNLDPAIDRIEIQGPYNVQGTGDTPSRRRIFVCAPTRGAEEKACATKIVRTLGRRAYRRPLTDDEVQTLLSFYEAGRMVDGFEGGIEAVLRRMLVSPHFLFRIERDPVDVPTATGYRLSDLELASRLSFFLWSSTPDDELLDVAERGELGEPEVLERQVRRMLADDRAAALVKNFAGQWLFLRNMRGVTPDPDAFPYFDDNLREALQRETELFVESVLLDDRNVLDFLTADYTFLNERLAEHYGVPDVYGNHFRRVTLSDPRRRGLLGQGSILTVTSYPTRTSPVLRGKWLLENILGAPPPPPPPDVPALEESDEAETPRSVRDRMEQHRRNPVCASCHATMDPLGFALENFDAVGRWRTSEAGGQIDASGALPDGTTFNGPEGLRELLVTRGEEFVATLAEKLFTYGIGRGVEYYDAPAIRAIVREAAHDDYRWSSLVLGIVKSAPFQMRRSQGS